MKTLVLGGTGAIGIYLIQLLKEQGVEIFVTSRKKIESYGNVHYLQGDAKKFTFSQVCLQMHEWDVVVDFMVYNTQDFQKIVNLLLNNTKQYVFLSSARVYAESKQPISEISSRLLDVSEDSEYLSTDEYALTKARQEDILKNSEFKNYTIIRPYITYSQNRLQLGVLEKEDWLYRALHGRTIVFSNDISSKTTTLTHGLDVAKALVAIIGNSKALGETFHITRTESKKWNEILAIYLNTLEKQLGDKLKVSFQNLDDFLNIPCIGKYQVLYDRLFDRYFNNDKIAQYIDTSNFISIEEGLNKCIEEFLKDAQFKRINWQKQARMDKICNERASLYEIQGIKQKVKYLFYRYY